MRTIPILVLAFAIALAPAVRAGEDAPGSPALAAAVAFSDALKAGDLERVKSLLDPQVLVLESGEAERSRDEYLREHASADAAFLKDARVKVLRRSTGEGGELAWVATESEIRVERDGREKAYASTETLVLRRRGDAWAIVHIHWSSHPLDD